MHIYSCLIDRYKIYNLIAKCMTKVILIFIITPNCKQMMSFWAQLLMIKDCMSLKTLFSHYFSIFRQQMIYKCSYSHDRAGLTVILKSICFPLWSIQFCWYDEAAIMSLKLSSSVNTPGDVLCNNHPLNLTCNSSHLPPY